MVASNSWSPNGLFRSVMCYLSTFISVFHTIVSLAKRLQKKGVIKVCYLCRIIFFVHEQRTTGFVKFRFQIVGRLKREVPTENPTVPTFLRLPPRKSLLSHLNITFFGRQCGVTVLLSRPNFVLF